MYSVHPADVPGNVWQETWLYSTSVVHSGWRSTSFRGWHGQPPSPFSSLFCSIHGYPQPCIWQKKYVFAHTFPIWNKLEEIFCHFFGLVCFLHLNEFFKLIKSPLLKPLPGYSTKQHCWRSFCFHLILYLQSLISIIYRFLGSFSFYSQMKTKRK